MISSNDFIVNGVLQLKKVCHYQASEDITPVTLKSLSAGVACELKSQPQQSFYFRLLIFP